MTPVPPKMPQAQLRRVKKEELIELILWWQDTTVDDYAAALQDSLERLEAERFGLRKEADELAAALRDAESQIEELEENDSNDDAAYRELEDQNFALAQRVMELSDSLEVKDGIRVISCDATARPYPIATVELRNTSPGEAMLTVLPDTPLMEMSA